VEGAASFPGEDGSDRRRLSVPREAQSPPSKETGLGLGLSLCSGVASAAMLPSPMLARAESTLPVGDYAYELRWDGFRATVSTKDGFRVRRRRGWDMAPLIPELARDDVRGVFDDELVAFPP
jgi:ATP-dependent DNA ligase